MCQNSIEDHVKKFKRKLPPEQSNVILAGTGPNASIQIPVLHHLRDEYLHQVKSLDVISASTFSLFAFIASQEKHLNLKRFRSFENYVREIHTITLKKRFFHTLSGKLKTENLYDNKLIEQVIEYSFGKKFTDRQVQDIPYPIQFHTFCTIQNKFITINKKTYPEMTFKEVARACMSIPPIHGKFHYMDHSFIDPIFSNHFASLRRNIFSKYNNILYVNHKKTQDSGSVYFITPQKYTFPELQLWSDFIKFYFGITNQKIIKTNNNLVNEKMIFGQE